jgi:hypothetical protein
MFKASTENNRPSRRYHAAVSGDGVESGLLKRGGDVFVSRFCELTSDYVAWKVHVTQGLLEVG